MIEIWNNHSKSGGKKSARVECLIRMGHISDAIASA